VRNSQYINATRWFDTRQLSPKCQLEQAKEAAEAARQVAESANRAKSLFLANMSHEIRTPMNAILGYAQLLERAPNLPSDQRPAVETIARSGNHLLAMINDVLDLSKIEAGRLELHEEVFDVGALVADLSAMFRMRCEQKGLEFTVECGMQNAESGVPGTRVRGDEGKLRQILINLLSNAVKFTEKGGVTLRLWKEEGRMQNEETTRPPAAGAPFLHSSICLLHFEVSDTGPGIAPEAQALLFEPFQRVHLGERTEGTGLGLALARRYAVLMGGELHVESRLGTGSRFICVVPLRPASHLVAPATPPAGTRVRHLAQGVRVRALVVDDVRDNREVLRQMLGDLGCEVEVAENGQEAVEMAGRSRPDIVFLDIRMPVMDGLEAAQGIRRRSESDGSGAVRRPRLVALSASALAHERQRYLDSGFDDFVAKPVDFERLGETLARLPGVPFEREARAQPEVPTAAGEAAAAVRLPRNLRLRLEQAARLYRTTELKQRIAEVETLGPAAAELAARLAVLNRAGKMQAILELLGQVQEEP